MGVVGAQVEVEGWQGRVRSVVLEPSARDLVDECKVEDMLAPLWKIRRINSEVLSCRKASKICIGYMFSNITKVYPLDITN